MAFEFISNSTTMFYTSHLFIKGAPLGRLWLAGTHAKKITKRMVDEADVTKEWCALFKPLR